MKRLALILMLAALPSAAQEVEQVTVYGGSLNVHQDDDGKLAAFRCA